MHIAVLGIPGSYHHQVAVELYPTAEMLHCSTFAEIISSVKEGKVDKGVIAIENSIIGLIQEPNELLKVADLTTELKYTLALTHRLVTVNENTLINQIKTVISHPAALEQCRTKIKEMGWKTQTAVDTASAVKEIMEKKEPHVAAISSIFAALLYGAHAHNFELQDTKTNSTTFAIIGRNI